MLQKQYLIPIKRNFLVFAELNFNFLLKCDFDFNIILYIFIGRTISSDWAIPKSKFCEKLEKGLSRNQETDKDEKQSQDAQEENNEDKNTYKKKITKEKDNLNKQKRRKLQKMKKQKKRARIVIRNLAFQVFILYI